MQWRRPVGWRPHDRSWRTALLFIVGSSLFAIGSFPPYSQFVDGRVVGITFVLGSLFFTAAGYSTFLQVINDDPQAIDASQPATKYWAWSPREAMWWAAVTQSIGTLLFNINTIDATVTTFTVEETNRLVWVPDFFGCIAFLVSSHIAWMHLNGRFWRRDTESAEWWSDFLPYLGSVLFMAAALASFTLTTTGEPLNIALVNTGTFLGAICFLLAAYVTLPATTPDTSH